MLKGHGTAAACALRGYLDGFDAHFLLLREENKHLQEALQSKGAKIFLCVTWDHITKTNM